MRKPFTTRQHLFLAAALSVTSVQLFSQEFRTISGVNNNLSHVGWGQAGSAEIRLTAPDYMDGFGEIRTDANSTKPNARAVSSLVFDQAVNQRIPDETGLSEMAWAWGQFIDHDIDFSSGGAESHVVAIPPTDPDFANDSDGMITVGRKQTIAGTGTGAGNPRQYPSDITMWIDASLVYGSDPIRAGALRSHGGTGPKLRTHAYGAPGEADDLLPTAQDFTNDGISVPSMDNSHFPTMGDSVRFVAGDGRANENTAILSLHTLMVREHNRIVDQLSMADPGLDDETMYQIARKVVGAEMQAITYEEYLPAHGLNLDLSGGYKPTTDPSIAVEFSQGIFRMAHTAINESALRLNNDLTPHAAGPITLEQSLFNPVEIHNTSGIEPFLLGLISNVQEATNDKMVPGLRNGLFQMGPTSMINDLATIDIERGRDVGLGSYNEVRMALGLDPVLTFENITSNSALALTLSDLYNGDVNEVDLWVGMLVEDRVSGTPAGETILKGLEDQFLRLAEGDRFFYLWDDDLSAFESTYEITVANRLADVMLANTSIPASSISNANNVMFAQPVPEPLSIMLVLCCIILVPMFFYRQ